MRKMKLLKASKQFANLKDFNLAGEAPVADVNVLAVNMESLDEFRKFKPNQTLNFIFPDVSTLDDTLINVYYNRLYKVVSYLREIGVSNKIEIEIINRQKFVKSYFFKHHFENVYLKSEIDYYFSNYKLEELQAEDKLLEMMVKDIKDSNLSVFEKYLSVYDIAKKFKEYKPFGTDDKSVDSRLLKYVLNNDYMVCVGFGVLFIELLNKIGINAIPLLIKLQEESGSSGHFQVISNLKDDKYNLDGFYVADPTNDNSLEDNFYDFALMSFDKVSSSFRMSDLPEMFLLMNVKSVKQFMDGVNYLLNLKTNKIIAKDKNNSEETSRKIAYSLIIVRILKILDGLDNDYKNELLNKYPAVLTTDFDEQLREQFLTEVGSYFVNHLGMNDSLVTVVEAATEVNARIYNFSDKEKEEYKLFLIKGVVSGGTEFFADYYQSTNIKK